MKYITFVVELINRKEKHFVNWKLKKITREFICNTLRQFKFECHSKRNNGDSKSV